MISFTITSMAVMRLSKSSDNVFRKSRYILWPILMILVLVLKSHAQNPGQQSISFDFAKHDGQIRTLNGINVGTDVDRGVFTDYMTQNYKELKIPYTRLHDCHYPHPDVVDIPAIFPLFHLDAEDPSNYNFKKTDDYIMELLKSGTELYFRLGVNIEHSKIQYHVHPPADYDKWARICVNIIRHYNEGWANGFHLGIKYWEVWNEPDVPGMWTGTMEQYFELYKTTVKAIKKHNPDLLVGTAGVASVYNLGPPLLDYCREYQLPIDFFSWHRYTADPAEVTKAALFARKLLDDHGYPETESHFGEWNYWPGSWEKLPDRYYWRDLATTEIGSAKSAAFTASVLIDLQDAPVDRAMFYSGAWEIFGLFDDYGIPRKSFYVFRAMAMLLDAPNRILCDKDSMYNDISVIAGLTDSEDEAIIMLSNFNSNQSMTNLLISDLPWENDTRVEVFVIDAESNLNLSPLVRTFEERSFVLQEELSAPAVKLIRLTRVL